MFSGMMPGRRPMSGLPGKQKQQKKWRQLRASKHCVARVCHCAVHEQCEVLCAVVCHRAADKAEWRSKMMTDVAVVLMGADGSRNGGGDDDLMLMVVALWWMVVGTVVAMNVTMMVI
jgi:hypothetical protein